MTDRLLRVARYCALLSEAGLADPNPVRETLASLLDEYLDGGDIDEPAIDAALTAIEGGSAHPVLLDRAGAAGVVRKARVLPSPPEVRLVVRQLRSGHGGPPSPASSDGESPTTSTTPEARQA